jgi:ABC-type antimicrobial peptide transport system permease subunit
MMSLALVVGTVGGAVGLVVARLLAALADVLAARKLPDFPFKPDTFFAFPPWLWGAGVLGAALFAALGAWGPARRAARIEPIAALSAQG